jgi:hypothetical protein
LQVLQSAKPPLRKAIISAADKEVIYALCEIIENLLLGNIPLSESQKNQLRKYRTQLRQVAQRGGGGVTAKRAALLKKGGSFIPLLLSLVSSVLPSLLQ